MWKAKYFFTLLAIIIFFGVLNLWALLLSTNEYKRPQPAQKVNFYESNSKVPNPSDWKFDVKGETNLKLGVLVHKEFKLIATATPVTAPGAELCRLKDPDSSAIDHLIGWHLPASTTYQISTKNIPASIGMANLRKIITAAFKTWTDINHLQISAGADVDYGRAERDNRNVIYFGAVPPGVLGAVYAWYDDHTGAVVEADTVLADNVRWSWFASAKNKCPDISSYDLQNVLSEEFGHWMGLNDENAHAYADNTMYSVAAKGEIKKTTLASGDIIALRAIYGSNNN